MGAVLVAAGALVVLLVMSDVFFTVLFPASEHGPVRKPVAWVVWSLFRLLGRSLRGRTRRNFIAYAGPVMIAATLGAWLALLVLGWAMIYKPALGVDIYGSGPTDTGWATALYFSGYNLTTLGVGDVVARTGPYRLLAVAQSAVGFTFFSIVVAYFLSVYSGIVRRNAFAQGLYHLTGRTNDAAELLARLVDGADTAAVRAHLASKADFLRDAYQTHRFYPVLRYFHYRQPQYALPRVLLTALDSATLIRSAFDPEGHRSLVSSLPLDGLFQSSMDLLRELVPNMRYDPPSQAEERQWRQRYRAAAARLAEAGVRLVGTEAGETTYVALRREWDRPLRAVADAMLYEWEAIDASSSPTG